MQLDSVVYGGLIAFGAVCMLLGFVLIARGIGGERATSTFKIVGVEISASGVGPGVLFALFGLVLIIVVLESIRLPAPATAGGATPAASAGSPVGTAGTPQTSAGPAAHPAVHSAAKSGQGATSVTPSAGPHVVDAEGYNGSVFVRGSYTLSADGHTCTERNSQLTTPSVFDVVSRNSHTILLYDPGRSMYLDLSLDSLTVSYRLANQTQWTTLYHITRVA